MNNNGVISFSSPVSRYDEQAFPISGSPFITPYWGDVDTRGTGEVLYRQTSDSSLLENARSDVLSVYTEFTSFTPTSLLIATWDHVGYFNSQTDLVSYDA